MNLWFTLEMPLPAKDLIFNQHQLLHGLSNSKSIHKKYKLKEKLRIKYAILDFFKELSAQFIDASLSFKSFFTTEFFAFSLTHRIKSINHLHI